MCVRLLESMPKPERMNNLRLAILAVLRRGAYQWLGAGGYIVGRATFVGLSKRGVLGVFHAFYRYIDRNYDGEAILWRSVREELEAFSGLLIFYGSGGPYNGTNLYSAPTLAYGDTARLSAFSLAVRLQPLVGFAKFSDSVLNLGPVPRSVRWAKYPRARQKLTRRMRMIWKVVSSVVVTVLASEPALHASRRGHARRYE